VFQIKSPPWGDLGGPSNQQPATSNQQPVTSNQQPVTSNQQPVTSNQQHHSYGQNQMQEQKRKNPETLSQI
ncbi:hypothetical protein, partial [Anaerophaga thermohalophila]|uniref:hypothetical protein n=1 Tax=Anaerophaga thermohalophila TaxID=177400 RepID=UPI001C400146